MNIAISIGHHKDSQGAEFEGVTEYALASGWAYDISDCIDGSFVVSGILNDKVRKINSKDARLAVEVHFNSYKIWEDANRDGIIDDDELRNAGRGSETLYMPKSIKGKLLAKHVQDQLGKIARPNRGIKEGWYRMDKKRGPDFFLRRTICPAIIIEPEFIHRLEEINKMKSQAILLIAQGIKEAYDILYSNEDN